MSSAATHSSVAASRHRDPPCTQAVPTLGLSNTRTTALTASDRKGESVSARARSKERVVRLLWAHPASSLIVSRKESSSPSVAVRRAPRRATRHARTKARRRSCSPLLRCTETGSRLNVVLSLLHASPRSPSRAPSARSPRREGFFFCSGPQPVGQAGDGRRNWLEIGWYLASLVERSLARSPGC